MVWFLLRRIGAFRAAGSPRDRSPSHSLKSMSSASNLKWCFRQYAAYGWRFFLVGPKWISVASLAFPFKPTINKFPHKRPKRTHIWFHAVGSGESRLRLMLSSRPRCPGILALAHQVRAVSPAICGGGGNVADEKRADTLLEL